MELPGYRLISQLGERTWRARRLSDQALVAVKFLAGADAAKLRRSAGSQGAPGASRPGVSEGKTAGVVRLEQVEDIPGGAAVVTPFIEGEALSRALERGVRMDVTRAVRLARSVAGGLAAAAARGAVHGALHPARIILRGDEAFVLGIGTGEGPGGLRPDGPHVYAAPELLSGKPSDCRADIYSLGAVLFHMLTGRPPFPQGSVGALKLAKTAELRWPRGSEESIPARVMRLVERMMAPEAEARHQDYDELLVGFEAATMRRTRRSRRRAVLDEEEEPRPRLRGALIAAAMVALAVALGMKTLLPDRRTEERPAPPPTPAGPARPAPEEETRAAKKEFQACVEALEADPQSAELLMPRLERLVQREDDIGVNAEILLAKLRRRAGGKEPPEPELAERPAAEPEEPRAPDESAEVKRRLDAARSAALTLVKLDPARAGEMFRKAIGGLDLGDYEEEAERIRAVIALAEEARAEEERRKQEEERLARLRERLPRAVAHAANLAGAFRYPEAAAALKGFLDENPPAEGAEFLRAYAGLVGREEKLFREIGRRYETGAEKGWLLFPENGEIMRIAGTSREGVTLVSDELIQRGLKEMRMPWMHITPGVAFKIFVEAADFTRADERLALAVFAFHRGLALECENELKGAFVLEPGFARELERARAVLDRVKKLRSPRRSRPE